MDVEETPMRLTSSQWKLLLDAYEYDRRKTDTDDAQVQKDWVTLIEMGMVKSKGKPTDDGIKQAKKKRAQLEEYRKGMPWSEHEPEPRAIWERPCTWIKKKIQGKTVLIDSLNRVVIVRKSPGGKAERSGDLSTKVWNLIAAGIDRLFSAKISWVRVRPYSFHKFGINAPLGCLLVDKKKEKAVLVEATVVDYILSKWPDAKFKVDPATKSVVPVFANKRSIQGIVAWLAVLKLPEVFQIPEFEEEKDEM
jgi:hypothetical protein